MGSGLPKPEGDAGGSIGLALLLVAVLAALSLVVPVPQPDLPGPLEYIAHAAAYGVVTYLALSIAHRNGTGVRWWRVGAVAGSLILLGAALEIAQRVVDREVSIADAVANSIGVAAALVAWVAARGR